MCLVGWNSAAPSDTKISAFASVFYLLDIAKRYAYLDGPFQPTKKRPSCNQPGRFCFNALRSASAIFYC
ncbi:MAG TPA: hypothetical protein DIW64_09510 [Cellvibrio sp.]|nr:hypothetical protein [Cellvibrio sp.]